MTAPTDNSYHLKQAKICLIEAQSSLSCLATGLHQVAGEHTKNRNDVLQMAATAEAMAAKVAEVKKVLSTAPPEMPESYGSLRKQNHETDRSHMD